MFVKGGNHTSTFTIWKPKSKRSVICCLLWEGRLLLLCPEGRTIKHNEYDTAFVGVRRHKKPQTLAQKRVLPKTNSTPTQPYHFFVCIGLPGVDSDYNSGNNPSDVPAVVSNIHGCKDNRPSFKPKSYFGNAKKKKPKGAPFAAKKKISILSFLWSYRDKRFPHAANCGFMLKRDH